ncbi:MAG: hypothetical protein ACRD3R_10980 [Terriglobales bacterium]
MASGIVISLSAALLVASCHSVSRIPARGTLSGESIETTVDSEAARYYLEVYLQGKSGDPALHDRIDALSHRYRQSLPSRDELRGISSDFSVDFASLFLADRLLRNECNRKLNQSLPIIAPAKPLA